MRDRIVDRACPIETQHLIAEGIIKNAVIYAISKSRLRPTGNRIKP